MSIYHAGSPLCMFSYLRLSLFSRPKLTKPSNVSIRALPFCAVNLVTIIYHTGSVYNPGLCFQNFTFVEFRMKTEPRTKPRAKILFALIMVLDAIEYAPSHSCCSSPCTLSRQRRLRIRTSPISQVFDSD